MTPLGKQLRILRLDKGWMLKDMADGAHVSSAFLSAVEMGRKAAPEDLIDRIAKWGRLGKEDVEKLDQALVATNHEVVLKVPTGLSPAHQEAAALLARTFGELKTDEVQALRELLARRKA